MHAAASLQLHAAHLRASSSPSTAFAFRHRPSPSLRAGALRRFNAHRRVRVGGHTAQARPRDSDSDSLDKEDQFAMEVEVKLSLADEVGHAAVLTHLRDTQRFVRALDQEDFFFDGAHQELSQRDVILRIRFFNKSERCVLALKGKAVIVDGVSRALEEEEEIAPAVGRECVEDPNKLIEQGGEIMRKVREDYGCKGTSGLGGFANTRNVFEWDGSRKLEVDETRFDFGVAYEIECETSQPEVARNTLEHMLSELQVPYAYSKHSKFHKFHKRSLFLE